ncbi:MAG TPA: ABC transporter substrate-binding protein [Solirubrobacteraceae bacterium]|jgi:peptide/nickel transport system substrate-binding protein|nr:ABC transporter substrate-binding protein [Solirubrobacteraceae bacterium]
MRAIRFFHGAIALVLLVLLAAGCGSGSKGTAAGKASATDTGRYQSPLTEPLTGGKRGGTLHVLDETDFERIDPGMAYYGLDYQVIYSTQRPLYSRTPNSSEPSPDLASGPPVISSDGKTVTVKIRSGVHFSPPVNREVTSADVAYAIDRGANPNVANPYFSSYYGVLEGAAKASGGPIKGIDTPDRDTIVFHLSEPKGQIFADALMLPLSAPVPKEYAAPFDAHSPSDYGNHQVATGPYMIKANSAGKVLDIGYIPGNSMTLVRNPNWEASTDTRPAYLDQIDIKIGGSQAVIGRQVLEGSDIVENEPPAQSSVEQAAKSLPSQLEISPGSQSHYIALNNKTGPFKNIDLRKALWAALDREALDRARGGSLVTSVATHFIWPTINGFDESGGLAGPQLDFNQHPGGDMAVAAKYMKLAGYPSGRYTGAEAITIVGSKGNPSEQDAEIVNQTLRDLGFKTKFTLVESTAMYGKYCGVPKEAIDVCPSVGWNADFADPQTVLDITFNGKLINPALNFNWSQTDVPAINTAITAAESVTGAHARAVAWGKIDTSLVEDATAIPFDWDKQANIEGRGVRGVGDIWNSGAWDYSYTSLD